MKPSKLSTVIIYGALILFAVFAVQPLVNLLALSLTDPAYAKDMTGLDILPKKLSLINYKYILSNPQIIRGILNSALYTITGVLLSVTLTVVAAYVLTREKLVGRKLMILITIFVMVFEPGIVPEYFVMKNVHLLGSAWSVILYKLVNVYYLIVMMRFFEDIPKEIEEAAIIDGCNPMQMLVKVFAPMSKPSIATITLFYSVFRWNEYFRSMIFLSGEPTKWPLQVILRQFVVLEDTQSMIGSFKEMAQVYGSVNFDALQAAAIIVGIVPVLLLYPIILKYFTKGTFEGSIK